jgi:hypothetical protein
MIWPLLSTALLLTAALSPQYVSATAVDVTTPRTEARMKYAKAHAIANGGQHYDFSSRDGWQMVNITDLQYKYRRRIASDIDQPNHDDMNLALSGHQENSNIGIRRTHEEAVSTRHLWTKKSKKSKKKGKKCPKKKPAEAKIAVSDGGSTTSQVLASVDGAVKDLSKIMKGTGKSEDVVITWYVFALNDRRICDDAIQMRRYTGQDLLNPSCWPESDWAPTVRECYFEYCG